MSDNTQTSQDQGPAVQGRGKESEEETSVEGRKLPYLSPRTPPLLSLPFQMCVIGVLDVTKSEFLINWYHSLLSWAFLPPVNIMFMTTTFTKLYHNRMLMSKPSGDPGESIDYVANHVNGRKSILHPWVSVNNKSITTKFTRFHQNILLMSKQDGNLYIMLGLFLYTGDNL